MELLSVKNLSKSFGGLAAVQDISLRVDKGSIVSLIGPNGAGKTTVFNLLTGFYAPDKGEVILEGEKISGLSAHDFVYRGMTRTFQNLRLFSGMTVLENVLVGYQSKINYGWVSAIFSSQKMKCDEAAAIKRALDVLDQLGLSEYQNELCMNLPYGIQKKIETARAMVSSPKILLLDEPAAGLNPQETRELSGFIRSLLDLDLTVFLIEHDMKLVMSISDYVYVMDHGIMLAQGLPQDVQQNESVIEAYIGRGGVEHIVKSQ